MWQTIANKDIPKSAISETQNLAIKVNWNGSI